MTSWNDSSVQPTYIDYISIKNAIFSTDLTPTKSFLHYTTVLSPAYQKLRLFWSFRMPKQSKKYKLRPCGGIRYAPSTTVGGGRRKRYKKKSYKKKPKKTKRHTRK